MAAQSDLKFSDLNTAQGATFISVSGSTITFDCDDLMGESSIALSDEKVAEFLTRLLDLANKAQTTYNTANPNDLLASYPAGFGGVPELDTTDNTYYVTTTQTLVSRAPLNKNATTGVPA